MKNLNTKTTRNAEVIETHYCRSSGMSYRIVRLNHLTEVDPYHLTRYHQNQTPSWDKATSNYFVQLDCHVEGNRVYGSGYNYWYTNTLEDARDFCERWAH